MPKATDQMTLEQLEKAKDWARKNHLPKRNIGGYTCDGIVRSKLYFKYHILKAIIFSFLKIPFDEIIYTRKKVYRSNA